MSITFQPYFNLDGLDVPFSFRRICNGAATMPLYMTIMPTDNSGALNVNYEYIKVFIKEESIEKLLAFLLKFLEAGVKSPDKPLKELMA